MSAPKTILIGGAWRAAASGQALPVEDPSTGEVWDALSAGSAADVDEAVDAARLALRGAWGALPAVERGRILTRMGRLVEERVQHLAQLEARDVGKPLTQARADARALARYLEFYGGAADKVHGETIPYQSGFSVLTWREPHGVTAHIVPWNYPMQIVGRSVSAALAMGNAAVLKPAEEAAQTALAYARIALEAGLPAGALNVVTGSGEEAGAALAGHPGVQHISFTGSLEVGRLVQAAAARHVAPVTLELGGKSPQIVFADAEMDQAIPAIVNAAIQNAGQTCSAGSRLLVERAAMPALADALARRFASLVAAPALADRDLGPLISLKQKSVVEGYIARARADGLSFLAEGVVAEDAPAKGHFVAPLLAAGMGADHPMAREEIFGPVLVILPFDTEEEAIAMANGAGYGLVAGVWTRDAARLFRVAKALRAGQVFLNNYGAGGGVELPFGGVGLSGHGREKGMEALFSFSTVKTVALRHG